ncbi:growth-regulating factor 10 isoform X2 [Macadamia integrifolia]|uniref:growth-regulating factor 10 isoform X2 n=1 Tax=Macadamia integrifolia TaxID=60698 RepID=UPI001C4FD6DC|nr:growth-regulating factor 10 isoform X2 [Macadamia integrifolia]
MAAHRPPSKIARADTGMDSMEGGSPLIGLGLGLGSGLNNGKSVFTFLQLQELDHQALIFKYMVAGVPVPFHLVLPIWKSVVSSFGGVNGGIYQHYPSCCSNFCFDYRNSMEPEPGRCRRTDGKKWRCSKDVVPDQKYCERHMHRGRNRSRKHVEASKITTTTASSNANLNTYKGIGNSSSNSNLSVSVPVSTLQLMTNNNSNNNGITPTPTPTPTSTSTSTSTNVSSSLGFSPKSVLLSGICKTESTL